MLDIVFQLQGIWWLSVGISVADVFIQPEPISGRWQASACKAWACVKGSSAGEQATHQSGQMWPDHKDGGLFDS